MTCLQKNYYEAHTRIQAQIRAVEPGPAAIAQLRALNEEDMQLTANLHAELSGW